MIKTIQQGFQYARSWPRHAVVGNLPESTWVVLLRILIRWLPVVCLLSGFLQWHYLGQEGLSLLITWVFFLLSLPFQGYYWMGKRSITLLPLGLRSWYFELVDKLNQQGYDIRLPSHSQGPCYADLSRVLNKALIQLPPHEY